jgi:hypothetical protein
MAWMNLSLNRVRQGMRGLTLTSGGTDAIEALKFFNHLNRVPP